MVVLEDKLIKAEKIVGEQGEMNVVSCRVGDVADLFISELAGIALTERYTPNILQKTLLCLKRSVHWHVQANVGFDHVQINMRPQVFQNRKDPTHDATWPLPVDQVCALSTASFFTASRVFLDISNNATEKENRSRAQSCIRVTVR